MKIHLPTHAVSDWSFFYHVWLAKIIEWVFQASLHIQSSNALVAVWRGLSSLEGWRQTSFSQWWNGIFKLALFCQCWMSFPSFITPSIIQCFRSCLKMSFIIGRMKFAFILPMMIDVFKLTYFCQCWMSFPSFIKPSIVNALLVVHGVLPLFLQRHLQTSFILSMLDEFSKLH